MFFFASSSVSAATPPAGAVDARGYFTGTDYNTIAYYTGNSPLDEVAPQTSPGPGSPNGFTASTDKTTFINKVLEFNSPGMPVRYRTAAALYISLMTGGGSRNRPPTAADIAQFESNVNNPDISIMLTGVNNSLNSGYYAAGDDEVFYTLLRGAVPKYSILFYNNKTGTPYTAIKIDCGNPLNQTALPNRPINRLPDVILDNVSCTDNLVGWARDPDTNGRLRFQTVVNGTFSSNHVANGARAEGGYADGYGYEISKTDLEGYNPRQVNTVFVRAYDANTGESVDSRTVSFGPCISSSCTSSTFSNILGVNEPQTFEVVSTLDAVWGPPYNTGPGGNNPDASTWTPAMYVTVRDPTGAAVYEQATKYTAGNPVATNVLTSFPISFTPTMPGKYFVQWGVSGGGIVFKPCGYGATAPDNVNNNNGYAGYQPYFRVEGGDMAAGAGFGNTGSCSSTTGDITGFNRQGSSAYSGATFFGAGSQLGAIARGNITGFSTATDNQPAANPTATSGVQPQPTGLAFSNSSYGIPGSFNRTSWCVSDYYAGSTADTAGSPDFSATGKHVYQVNGSTTLNGGSPITLANGADITVKVIGDVIIANDINYSYGSLDQMPRFRLLVTGNIYIQSNVHNLHGFYDAQPTGGSGGRVYTCASGPAASTNYTNCNSQLSVYGSITANRIIPGRTKGNYNDNGNSCNGNGNNCNGNNGNGNGNTCNGNNGNGNGNTCNGNGPAESFEYSPELWIFSATSKPTAGSGYSSYDSITNLPPVL